MNNGTEASVRSKVFLVLLAGFLGIFTAISGVNYLWERLISPTQVVFSTVDCP